MTDEHDSLRKVPSQRLARLIEAAETPGGSWNPADLAALLRHQLLAPLQEAFGTHPDQDADVLQVRAREKSVPENLHQLFQNPVLSPELLRAAKNRAKADWKDAVGFLPREVSITIYFAAIAAALTRCRARITRQGDDRLRAAFMWMLDQPWIDARTKDLFREGLDQLSRPETGGFQPN